ncbi:caffeine-induced death protein-like protein Cid2 [Sporormia fimetaria CBS 119925]|uniref:Caffeine-induced death protein-like protein Cid2 n=1 Tax=Sporormia fimetaria CBS 119925 TaxID=1340428 RepID=A0A6A6V5G4_9PLEO|nr:caffeine-induced death protein-like protein Cid2 [Sporormia fimetaria CBS 119925]
MSQPSEAPRLTPQFCFNQTALRDFLRLSRSTIDDSITQNLNALLTPAAKPWDPSSVHTRQLSTPSRAVPPESCDRFKQQVLFPSWKVRSDVLDYCSGVATSPDPDDPDQILRQVEDDKARERVVDERLDPYSGRYFPREARTESLAMLMRNERAVERIIRTRTWSVMGERCGFPTETSEEAFDRWRRDGKSGSL